jgi:CoA:oxalate CoA-transferase
MSPSTKGAFDGLTVIELGQFVVVPFCGQFMADGGARVIKIEPLSGDSYRSADPLFPKESRQFAIKNRGKESVSLRVGTPGAAEVIRRLVGIADVVLVNMRQQTVERHGLTYEALRAVNPDVIYGNVTGFGSRGPEAAYAGMDVVAQARSGLIQATGSERDGVGYHSEVQFADYTAALLLLAGISAALYARERTGEGQMVEVSLLGAALTIQNNVFADFYEHDEWRADFLNDVLPKARAERWSAADVERVRSSMRSDPRSTDLYRVFATSDGSIAVGAGNDALAERLLQALGIDSPITDERTPAQVAQQLTSGTSDEWISRLRAAGIPVSAVNHVEELLHDPHVEAEGLVYDFDHPVLGRYRGLGTPIRLSETPISPSRSSPAFAEHTLTTLSELGFGEDEIARLLEAGAIGVTDGSMPRVSS